MEEKFDKYVALQLQTLSPNSFIVGAAVYSRTVNPHSSLLLDSPEELSSKFYIELFQFTDNAQLSCLDAFLNQLDKDFLIYLSNEWENNSKGIGRKVQQVLSGRNVDCMFMKRSVFSKKTDTIKLLLQISSKDGNNNAVSVLSYAENERQLSIDCVECIFNVIRLREGENAQNMAVDLRVSYLDSFMRLDTAASEAVNLLPKPDHPSQFGSLFGVLNRCRTTMGSRLLERWLRQPLLNIKDINLRLDVVEVMHLHPASRNKLRDGPLKGISDLELVIAKLLKKKASLAEIYRLYTFSKTIPAISSFLSEIYALKSTSNITTEKDSVESSPYDSLCEKFLTPLEKILNKFSVFERLVEHVIDFNQLPELKVNPQHDPELQELATEQAQLEADAEAILQKARQVWAVSADVKLEKNSSTNSNSTVQSFLLRTTRADERELKSANASVEITSILKNGIYFTVPQLRSVSDRYASIQVEYREKQQELVEKAVETASTYVPLLECVASLVAELDVLIAFATAAALSPGVYVRPKMLPKGAGELVLLQARHPCVELMDGVDFIPNDYVLRKGQSEFQIVTGPNMGGKSTYIRAVGAICVLAQVGMFVPCQQATMSVVDCILARVGAGDAVQKGVSTFMAEMLESSTILQNATADSLIIIDELGRGTSTFDGFGLAWAISDYISTQLGSYCLFATHFHELTALAKVVGQESKESDEQRPRSSVVNKHVAACINERNDEVLMLHKVEDGPCLQSYGIHIAKSADFPASVLVEAKRKAHELENTGNCSAAATEKFRRVEQAVDEFAQMKFDKLPVNGWLDEPLQKKLKVSFRKV
mmetsp:Transcript_31903/g.45919  ORF Transcript_31903/g.45919 Transcript_31903/m.45919 type:complete len:825 (-) Transcript_31903:85-2559(-)